MLACRSMTNNNKNKGVFFGHAKAPPQIPHPVAILGVVKMGRAGHGPFLKRAQPNNGRSCKSGPCHRPDEQREWSNDELGRDTCKVALALA